MIKFYCDLIKDKYSNSSSNEVTLEDSDGKATGSQMVVIEGKNTATVSNSTLECSGKGNFIFKIKIDR